MRCAVLAVFALAFASNGAGTALAEIKDYEVLRFLYLKTPCGMAKVTSRDVTAEHARFTAECQNETAFPDDAVVICSDQADDRSCRLEKQYRDFKHLELLRPKAK
ncbi:MAG: hypothetical protein IKE66_13470 [Hyphomicrobium sp.]|nr:hypothetical protein [Hyphomicrobium sp.]